jgi:glucose-1-phosphate adenylyltransferase
MHQILGLILGGGRGEGLYPLTKYRSAPAVPVAGKYRLIDIPTSNCINSGVQRIFVLTQFLSVSLHRHIANTYKFDPFSQGFVEVLAAQQTNETAGWYQGTADAIRQNLRYIQVEPVRNVLILCGDGLYRMNFRELLGTHENSRADCTLVVHPVTRAEASQLGVVHLDASHRLTELVEKPQTAEQLDRLRVPGAWLERRGLAGTDREYLANTGIYLCRCEVLMDWLESHPQATDLVTQLIADSLQTHRIQAHLFDGYWQDVGSIKTYHQANLALASEHPPFDFHSADGVIYTRMRNLPASQVRAARLVQSLISDGCLIREGANIERCVIGVRTRIGQNAMLRDTVVIGADDYETARQRVANHTEGLPDLGVGDRCVIERAILDKDCRIGADVRIVNQRGLREAEGDNYVIRDGIVVIPNGAVVPAGTVI